MEKQPVLTFSNEEYYKLLFESAPDGVVLINQNNQIRFWNPKAEAIFGWTSGEVLGEIVSHVIVPPAFREAHDNGMRRYLATGEIRVLNKTIEVPALHKNGREFFISLTISKIEFSGETGFLAFIRDVTEQKNNQLQLEQKTKELERMNLQLEEFAFIASHDLKEPLRKISLYSNLMMTSEWETLSDKGKGNMQKISEASVRMQKLIEGILSYSSYNGQEDKVLLSLEELCAQAIDSLEYKIKETGAIITSDGLPKANVIAFQIQQLFQNLIGNALKFSKKEEHLLVEISHSFVSSDNKKAMGLNPAVNFVAIKVVDNGIGFSNDAAEKIFGLFNRLHNRNDYEGSGLGLAICRKIVENHGGLIFATSQPGAGSTFTILLPIE